MDFSTKSEEIPSTVWALFAPEFVDETEKWEYLVIFNKMVKELIGRSPLHFND